MFLLALELFGHEWKSGFRDTGKFGGLEWRSGLERETQWLGRDKTTLSRLRDYNIGTKNPREDTVGPDKIAMLITEVGAFPPSRIPKCIKR